jgi:hypothetical protein
MIFGQLFCQKRFLEKFINLRIIKKLAILRKICQDIPLENPPATFLNPRASSENSLVLDQKLLLGRGRDGLGRHPVPPLLAVNCSYFDLFYEVT